MHTSIIIIYIVVCKTLSLETQQADYFIDELEEVSSEGLASKRPNASAELSTYYISLGDIKPGFAGDSTTLIFVYVLTACILCTLRRNYHCCHLNYTRYMVHGMARLSLEHKYNTCSKGVVRAICKSNSRLL